eukprot:c17469_g1_i1.p1 GENE.c17469_g1_i1~~c17469_g1_i1.p1  ORF type:complete len:182 (-),score=79.73 c17469_g1_i1:116-661(-)
MNRRLIAGSAGVIVVGGEVFNAQVVETESKAKEKLDLRKAISSIQVNRETKAKILDLGFDLAKDHGVQQVFLEKYGKSRPKENKSLDYSMYPDFLQSKLKDLENKNGSLRSEIEQLKAELREDQTNKMNNENVSNRVNGVFTEQEEETENETGTETQVDLWPLALGIACMILSFVMGLKKD